MTDNRNQEVEELVGKTVKRQYFWDRAKTKIREEFELLTLKHKGKIYQIRVGENRKYDENGQLVKTTEYTTTTYLDRDDAPYIHHATRVEKYYEDGKHVETELWKPTYGRPYNSPTSLFKFTMVERTKH